MLQIKSIRNLCILLPHLELEPICMCPEDSEDNCPNAFYKQKDNPQYYIKRCK